MDTNRARCPQPHAACVLSFSVNGGKNHDQVSLDVTLFPPSVHGHKQSQESLRPHAACVYCHPQSTENIMTSCPLECIIFPPSVCGHKQRQVSSGPHAACVLALILSQWIKTLTSYPLECILFPPSVSGYRARSPQTRMLHVLLSSLINR